MSENEIDGFVQIRKDHLSHETSIRAIGNLYAFSSVLGGMMLLAVILEPQEKALTIGTMTLVAVLLLFYLQVGLWLRALNAKARVPATILAILGLFAFPFGTLVSICVLYLLHSKKGRTIFSGDYQRVLSNTPNVRYRTSKAMWVLACIVVILVIAAVVAPFFSQK
jgi:hypothetical protein